MKKSALLVSLALVLVLSVTSFAQLATSLKGSVEMDLTYRQEEPLKEGSPFKLIAKTKSQVTLGLSAQHKAGSLEAIFTFSDAIAGKSAQDWTEWSSDLKGDNAKNPLNIAYNGVRLQATGAWWKGGPELTTVMGKRTASWNKYTAHNVGVNGIEVSTLKVGPVELRGYYGWTKVGTNETAAVLHAKGSIDKISFNGYVTNFGDQTSKDRKNNFTVDASVSPVSDVTLSGVYSYDGANEGSSYKVEATVKTIPNLTLQGRIRVSDDQYQKVANFTDTGDGRAWHPNEKNYWVKAETTQSGVTLTGTYEIADKYKQDPGKAELTTKLNGIASTTIEGFSLKADVLLTQERVNEGEDFTSTTKTVLTVGKTIANVKVDYTGTIETERKMTNQVTASTTIDTPIADKVTLNGAFIYDPNEPKEKQVKYGADATWTAPNGVSLAVGYANYDKRKTGDPDNWKSMGNPNGFFIRAYSKVSW